MLFIYLIVIGVKQSFNWAVKNTWKYTREYFGLLILYSKYFQGNTYTGNPSIFLYSVITLVRRVINKKRSNVISILSQMRWIYSLRFRDGLKTNIFGLIVDLNSCQ